MENKGNQLIEDIQKQKCFLCEPISPDLLIWEDNNFIVLLDAYPSVKGHVIIASKEHVEALSDLSEELSSNLMMLARKVDEALRQIFNPFRVAIVSSGLAVKHLHFHVIPIPNEEMMWGFKYLKKDDLVEYATDERLNLISQIRKFL